MNNTVSPNLQQLMQIFIRICDAMAYSHSKGVLHLDLKPANIQLGEYGEALVCDWGLAKLIHSDDMDSDTGEKLLDPNIYNEGTLDGIVKGSPGYLAPEQIDRRISSKSIQTDIYCLGGILYYMLTKKPPIAAADLEHLSSPKHRARDRNGLGTGTALEFERL